MNALLGKIKQGNTHIFYLQTFIISFNLNKELKLIFSPHQVYDI